MMGMKSAFDPNGALVIRPELDTRWLRWLWAFRGAASRERFLKGVEALHNLNDGIAIATAFSLSWESGMCMTLNFFFFFHQQF